MLDRHLAAPLSQAPAVRRRLDAVELLSQRPAVLAAVRGALRGLGDAEQASRRLALGRSRAAVGDLACLREALATAAAIAPVLRAALPGNDERPEPVWVPETAWTVFAAAARQGFDWSGAGGGTASHCAPPSLLECVCCAIELASAPPDHQSQTGEQDVQATFDSAPVTSGPLSDLSDAAKTLQDLHGHLDSALVRSLPAHAGAAAGIGALGRSPRVAANKAAASLASALGADPDAGGGGGGGGSGTRIAGQASGVGSWVRLGYHSELDEAYELRDGALRALGRVEAELRELTGQPSIRVSRFGEGGHLADVSKRLENSAGVAAAVQSGAMWRVRSLKASTRFKTSALVQLDNDTAEAAGRVRKLEGETFDSLAARVRAAGPALSALVHALAVLDVAASHAATAQVLGLRKPVVLQPGTELARSLPVPCGGGAEGHPGNGSWVEEDVGSGLYLRGCRHLVVEKGLQGGWGAQPAHQAAEEPDDAARLAWQAGPDAWARACTFGDESSAPDGQPSAGASPAKTFVPADVVLRGRLRSARGSESTGSPAEPHPALQVVEGLSPRLSAVADSGRQWLVTGPNVAGKSTILRSTAQAVLLAQAGSFVPAREAVIGAADRLFARVGASDDLARERSTFLVEMEETAAILRGATPASLIIIDELGRGTSAEDGLAVAAATLSELAEPAAAESQGGSRVLFATHFQELAAVAPPVCGGGVADHTLQPTSTDTLVPRRPSPMARQSQLAMALREGNDPASLSIGADTTCSCARRGVRCMTMDVWMNGTDATGHLASERPVFSYKVVPGVAKASLGLAAAQRAGVPPHVIERAAKLLASLRV